MQFSRLFHRKTLLYLAGTAGLSQVSRLFLKSNIPDGEVNLSRWFKWSGPTLQAKESLSNKFMALPVSDLESLENTSDMKVKMELLILKLQEEFCRSLEAEETSGKKFSVDKWERKKAEEGGGITCVLEGGETFERAGVNITVMRAPLSAKLQHSMRERGKKLPSDRKFEFFAAGVSSVIHPVNPHVPTVHFNFRYFEVQDEYGENKHSWFGGGADLTPYYLNRDDAVTFHSALKDACDKHGKHRYPEYKRACDKYFRNPARGECRGIGGIFFDDLESDETTSEFEFVEDCTKAIIPCYLPIIQRRKHMKYGETERNWQLLRRGRYVEFNLVYDRGTKFGFATPGARIESVLVSLPLLARWEYRHTPKEGSPEHAITEVLKNPQDWL